MQRHMVPNPEVQDSERQTVTTADSSRLRWTGLLLCAVALLTAGHVVISMIQLFQGQPLLLPEFVLHVEAGVAGATGLLGLCRLVAGAQPFDESEEPPLLKYEKQARDPFDV